MANIPDKQPHAYSLEDFLDAGTLQEIQSAFSAATGVEICFRNRAGRPITVPDAPERFCVSPCGQADGTFAEKLQAMMAGPLNGPACIVCGGRCEHLAIPILADGAPLGIIILAEEALQARADAAAASRQLGLPAGPLRQDNPHVTSVADLAQMLASLLGRLCHQDLQLRMRIEELGAIYSITGLLAGSFDLPQVLNEVVRRVGEVMRVKSCSLRLFNEDTGELVIKAVYNLSPAYLNKGAVRVSENPVDAAALSGQTVYIEDVPNDPRVRYPEEARREGLCSGLVTGMFHRGKPIGVLRVYTGEKHRFTAFEAGLLRAMAAQAGSAIETARLYQEALQAERVSRQIMMASDVQRRMIPATAPKHPRLTFGTVYQPSLGVGGDFYDFIELPGGQLGLAIADVVGKGIPAALMMASVRSVLRATALQGRSLARTMEEVNRHLSRDTLVNEFATVFYCVLSADGRRLTYCNAGHNPPLLLRKGKIRSLSQGGLVIGIHRDERYGQSRFALQPNDVLLLYTDGITEARNFEGRQFGIERLRESLLKYGRLEARPIVNNILWDVRRFVGLAEQADDQTMVVVKVM